jgi:inosine/xanthosine triphosphatase
MTKIIVASTNPVKLKAAEIGYKRMFAEDSEISGLSVPSGVSNQPMSEDETLKGAMNRAKNAKENNPDADFWVGIEGGIEDKNSDMHAFAWIAVINSDGKTGKGKTGTFILPEKIAELIRQGKELGEADDIVFGYTNSKQKNGSIGILTGDVLTRAGFYSDAVIMALIPFKNPNLY